jgi:hypothetical protein
MSVLLKLAAFGRNVTPKTFTSRGTLPAQHACGAGTRGQTRRRARRSCRGRLQPKFRSQWSQTRCTLRRAHACTCPSRSRTLSCSSLRGSSRLWSTRRSARSTRTRSSTRAATPRDVPHVTWLSTTVTDWVSESILNEMSGAQKRMLKLRHALKLEFLARNSVTLAIRAFC